MAVKWNLAQVEEYLRRQSESGLSQKAFCLQNDIKYNTFLFWKTKRVKRPEPKEPFIKVSTVGLPGHSEGLLYQLQIGPHVLKVPRGFNIGEVRALFDMLSC